MDREDIDRLIKDVKKILDKINREDLKPTFDFIKNEVAKHLKELKLSLNNTETIVRLAWQYEEKNCNEYGLEEAIEWFKANIPTKKNRVSGCIYKEMDSSFDFYKLGVMIT